MTGIKGSFSMLCNNKKFVLISCNKQIVKMFDDNIIQKGIIVGGLENERSEIKSLAKKICNVTEGIFWFNWCGYYKTKWKVACIRN